MTDELERRWDDAIEAAWVELRQRVADRLAAMGEDETFLLEVPDEEGLEGATPYCQVVAGPGILHVEAVSDAYLAPEHSLDAQQEDSLLELGFVHPQHEHGWSANFAVRVEQREADRAAWMMVEAMRRVYGVIHPVYLEVDGEGHPSADAVSRLASLAPQPPDGRAAQFPESPEEVTAALVEVVSGMIGKEAELDEDGDLPIQTDRTVLFVTVSQRAPRVLVFSTLVTDVVDEQRALVEVNLLNKAEFGLTFVVAEGRITVRRELPVTAFVPSDIRLELTRLCNDADGWVTELIARVGGRAWLEDGEVRQPQDRRPGTPDALPADGRYEAALRVLRELESEERGSVDPVTIARIFHGDRDLLLHATRWALSRSVRWGERRRKADGEGKAAYAKACRARQGYYRELRGRLRQALRSVVQAPSKPARGEQLSLFAEDEASA